MKNTFFQVSRAAALAVCAIAASQVQAATIPSLSVNVPFDFVVAGKTLPAGQYSVISVSSTGGAPIFMVRNDRTSTSAFSVTTGRFWLKDTDPKSAQVVFACLGESCYMKELKIPGWDGYVVSRPKLSPAQQERQVALNARFAATGQ